MSNESLDGFMSQMQKMKGDLDAVQEKLMQKCVETASPDGAVKIRINGNQIIQEIVLDPKLLSPANRTSLQSALITTLNEALFKSRQMVQAELYGLAQNTDLSSLLGR